MRTLLAIFATTLLWALPAAAQGFEGRWAARTAEGTYAILTVARDSAAPSGWRATFARPKGSHFGSNGRVGNLGTEVDEDAWRVVAVEGDRMTVEETDGKPGGPASRMVLTMVEADHLLLGFQAFRFQLFFARARDAEQVTTQWRGPAEQQLIEEWPDNAEIARMFAEDQAVRQGDPGKIDWAVVGAADDERRRRARELLEAGALHSGNDFYAAAFLFQHGAQPEDYLAAHTLAVAAAARGRIDAGWIAAASLDRYLRSIGKPQVYGTQFSFRDGAMTQEPYDPAAVPDALRAVAGVPSRAEQEAQRQAMEAQAKAANGP